MRSQSELLSLVSLSLFLLNTCNVSYLLAHQRLAVLQVVSLHDGRAVEFGQRMRAPTVTGRGTIDEGRSLRTCESFVFFLSLWLHLLCLVEVVGASVIDVVAESRSHHGKGIEVGVVLPQPACLHAKDGGDKIFSI